MTIRGRQVQGQSPSSPWDREVTEGQGTRTTAI